MKDFVLVIGSFRYEHWDCIPNEDYTAVAGEFTSDRLPGAGPNTLNGEMFAKFVKFLSFTSRHIERDISRMA